MRARRRAPESVNVKPVARSTTPSATIGIELLPVNGSVPFPFGVTSDVEVTTAIEVVDPCWDSDVVVLCSVVVVGPTEVVVAIVLVSPATAVLLVVGTEVVVVVDVVVVDVDVVVVDDVVVVGACVVVVPPSW